MQSEEIIITPEIRDVLTKLYDTYYVLGMDRINTKPSGLCALVLLHIINQKNLLYDYTIVYNEKNFFHVLPGKASQDVINSITLNRSPEYTKCFEYMDLEKIANILETRIADYKEWFSDITKIENSLEVLKEFREKILVLFKNKSTFVNLLKSEQPSVEKKL